MGLSTSLFTGVSALKGFQRGLEVTGNNIANSNSYGFKSQRMEYKDSFYNTLNRSVAGDANFGVTSTANQIGTGLDSRTISTNFNQGMIDSTGVDTDVAILGEGFFKVNDLQTGGSAVNESFTRAGNFRIDNNGYLVTQDGKFIQGQTIGDGALTMTVEGTSDGQGTQADGFAVDAANINAADGSLTVGNLTLPADFFGGKGYLGTDNGVPEIKIIGDGMTKEPVAKAIVTDGVVTGIEILDGGMGFTNAVVRIEEPPGNNLRYTKTAEPALGDIGSIQIKVPTMTLQDNTSGSGVTKENVEALAPGMQAVSVEPDGNIRVYLDNGESLVVGKVLLQDFRAPQALRRVEGGYFLNDGNAGQINDFSAVSNAPGGPGLGLLRQGSLELSNTSMTDEFANLITYQRSFQGAARIITTSDEVLREAVNLKR